MIQHNVNTLWGQAIADELSLAGITHVCITPGGRSAPLTLALLNHPDIHTYVHLDERSAGFFALGRAKLTGIPTPVVCTSGTAVANLHPSIVEASLSRTPMMVLTADRPSELLYSGSNQTIPQDNIFSNTINWSRTLPEPELTERKFLSLRSSISRSLSECMGVRPGPVHLNFPFKKPLIPGETIDESVIDFINSNSIAARGRSHAYTQITSGILTLSEKNIKQISDTISQSKNGIIVVGPSSPNSISASSVSDLSMSLGFPILADPLSGVRFGEHIDSALVCGGYDSYINSAITQSWVKPDLIIRFGAAPVSIALQNYLKNTGAYEFLIDPTGQSRDPTFFSSELIVCDPNWFCDAISNNFNLSPNDLSRHLSSTESNYWKIFSETSSFFEGTVAHKVLEFAPPDSTITISNSMPIRDVDRFGMPSTKNMTLIGNRGASGIDGVTSTALGVASASTNQAILFIGDIAYYHDISGLLALNKFNLKLIIIEINNNGGGIFYRLPVSKYDPPFTAGFQTPHNLDLSHTSKLYGFDFTRVSTLQDFSNSYADALERGDSCIIEVVSDPIKSHASREQFQNTVIEKLQHNN